MTTLHVLKVLAAQEGWHAPTERVVLVQVAYRANKRGYITCTQTDIARVCRVSRQTVSHYFDQLRAVGIIERIAHGRYRLLVESLDQLEELLSARCAAPAVRELVREFHRFQAIRRPH